MLVVFVGRAVPLGRSNSALIRQGEGQLRLAFCFVREDAMPKGPFTPSEFVPTEWSTAADKADFGNALLQFLDADCPRELFANKFYTRLSMTLEYCSLRPRWLLRHMVHTRPPPAGVCPEDPALAVPWRSNVHVQRCGVCHPARRGPTKLPCTIRLAGCRTASRGRDARTGAPRSEVPRPGARCR